MTKFNLKLLSHGKLFKWKDRFYYTHSHTHKYQVKKKSFQDTVLSVFKDRKFLIHILLKPGLENFEHYFGSM